MGVLYTDIFLFMNRYELTLLPEDLFVLAVDIIENPNGMTVDETKNFVKKIFASNIVELEN